MTSAGFALLDPADYDHHLARFESCYPHEITNAVADADAPQWLRDNVAYLDCPDPAIEEIYYFRWWTFRRHLKSTPDGFVVTEFLAEVGHGEQHNTINCPVGHHLYEGRWVKDRRYLDDYTRFMLRGGGNLHTYSCWFADALWQRALVQPDDAQVVDLLGDLLRYSARWDEHDRDGLATFTPWMDGMEYSISGNLEPRSRPTLNSYRYGDALAIAAIAGLAGDSDLSAEFDRQATQRKQVVQQQLWHPDLRFFATRDEAGRFTPVDQPVREHIGFIPWYFGLPDPGHESAWQQFNDPAGFCTPVGLSSAEIRHPRFLQVEPERLACWDGGIWPFGTSQVLTAAQRVLREYEQTYLTAADYRRELHKYATSHTLDGQPSIAEVLRDPYERRMCGAEHYNHSTYADLVTTGLAGLVPRSDGVLEVDPLLAADWPYFCLDGIGYHGHLVTVSWDRDGGRYGEPGFHVDVDQVRRASRPAPSRVLLDLER